MKTYSVVLSYADVKHAMEVTESADLAAMLQLAGLICQHATPDVSSVKVWESDGGEMVVTAFSWSPEGLVSVR